MEFVSSVVLVIQGWRRACANGTQPTTNAEAPVL